MTKTSNELVWIKMLLEELHLTIIGSLRLWRDNLIAMHSANTPLFCESAKHFELERHDMK